jgi:hypothetical protein
VTGCGTPFVVDDDTFEWAQHEKWFLKKGYPCRYLKGSGYGAKDYREVYLHRELMDFPIGHVHHKDENPLNCQRGNLKALSVKEHCAEHGDERRANARARCYRSAGNSQSGFKGVYWHKAQRGWTASIKVDGKIRSFGYYDTADDAALVYDAAVIAYRGPGSYTNLIPNEE